MEINNTSIPGASPASKKGGGFKNKKHKKDASN